MKLQVRRMNVFYGLLQLYSSYLFKFIKYLALILYYSTNKLGAFSNHAPFYCRSMGKFNSIHIILIPYNLKYKLQYFKLRYSHIVHMIEVPGLTLVHYLN